MRKTMILAALLGVLLMAGNAFARYDDDLERIRIEGRITSIRGQVAYVRDDCGIVFRVHLGPEWYWRDNHYYLHSGWRVRVIAWQDPYEDFCYAEEIRGDDFCYDLCDNYGFPRWQTYEECDYGWRPTRSFFTFWFIICEPSWRYSHHHYWQCHVDYWHDHPHYRTWYSNYGRDHDRHGRRDHDGGRFANEDSGRDKIPLVGGNDYDSQIVKPRSTEKSPGGSIQKKESGKSQKSYSSKKEKSDSKSSYTKPSSKSSGKSSGKSSSKSSSKSYSKSSSKSSGKSSGSSDQKSYARK
ncbi:MAG: hypothetical protein H6505_02495 [Calditrichaeota bacterium]|nr:hypothetical protein [Calditrichota bacterium]